MAEERIEVLKLDDPDLELKLKELQGIVSAGAPEHVQALGKVLRSGSMASFRRHLLRMEIEHNLSPRQLKLFRDYIITKRIDLKDKEPEARANLREDTLKDQPEEEMTLDYKRLVEPRPQFGRAPGCRSCAWFARVPPGEEKTCAQLGAKGSDAPCYGFTLYRSYEYRTGKPLSADRMANIKKNRV